MGTHALKQRSILDIWDGRSSLVMLLTPLCEEFKEGWRIRTVALTFGC
jgi:hypothetical protein